MDELEHEASDPGSVCIVKQEDTSDGEGTTEASMLHASNKPQINDSIEFNSTEIMPNPFNNKMCCLHCLKDIEHDDIFDHMVTEHGYRKMFYKCQVCLLMFSHKHELNEHKKHCKVVQKKPKRKTFQQILRDLDVKIEQDSEEETTSACPICLLELPNVYLKEHVIEVHSNPFAILTCGICNRHFKSKLSLREHIRFIHNDDEPSVYCEQCGQEFRSKKYLSNHRRNVHPKGDKIFKCAHCGKVFKSHLCLHQHLKYVHPPESAAVECPMCPKMFKSKINLYQHIKITHGGTRKKKFVEDNVASNQLG